MHAGPHAVPSHRLSSRHRLACADFPAQAAPVKLVRVLKPSGAVCSKKPGKQSRPGGEFDKDKKEVRQPYQVKVVTPPPRDLGLHCFPQNTQCGETIDVEGESFIVSGVTYTYRLNKGKYTPDVLRLDVQSCGRYLVNLYLDDLLKTS